MTKAQRTEAVLDQLKALCLRVGLREHGVARDHAYGSLGVVYEGRCAAVGQVGGLPYATTADEAALAAALDDLG